MIDVCLYHYIIMHDRFKSPSLQLNVHSYSSESDRDIKIVAFIQIITQLNIRGKIKAIIAYSNCNLSVFFLINFTLQINTRRYCCGKQIKNVF
jgi:hypothetical protein